MKKDVSQLNQKEMIEELSQMPLYGQGDRREEILNEAYKKNLYPVLEFIAKDKEAIILPSVYEIVMNYIDLKKNGNGRNLLKVLLDNPPEVINGFNGNKFSELCHANPKLSATALLHKNTPTPVTSTILVMNDLADPMKSIYLTTDESMSEQLRNQNNILVEIIRMLRTGWKWENELSASTLINRLNGGGKSDLFMTEAVKNDMSKQVTTTILKVLGHNQNYKYNKKILDNIDKNEYPDVTFAKMTHKFETMSDTDFSNTLSESLAKNIDHSEFMLLWNYFYMRLQKESFFDINHALVFKPTTGKNILVGFAEKSPSLAIEVMKLLKKWANTEGYHNLARNTVEDLVELGLNNQSLQDLTLSLPKELFNNIALKPNHREMVEKQYAEPEQPEDLDMSDIFSNKANWYQKYSQSQLLQQEAGITENIAITLLSSLVLILTGSTVKSAAERNNLREEQVMEAMDNPYLMEQAKNIAKTDNPEMREPVKRSMPYGSDVDSSSNDPFLKEAFDYIKKHEGIKLTPYRDPNIHENIQAIGVGHVILPHEDFSEGITEEEAFDLFRSDIQKKINTSKNLFPYFDSYPTYVKVALLDGVFRGEHKKGHRTVNLINNNRWEEASKEYVNRTDYRESLQMGSGVHKRMNENAERMEEYSKELA